ncbi:MAG: AAA family ATPase [Planctomycetaceae bacterium]|nr:AAA family ATPase [Planctomycetaceae bacterium]
MATLPARSRPVRKTRPRTAPTPRCRAALCGVSTTGSGLPLRVLVHGADGVGKTSWAAHFPSPVFLYPASDTGLETLLDRGRIPPVSHFEPIHQWEEVGEHLGELLDSAHNHRTVVIDGLGGLERLCQERVCVRDFDGDWGELGFHGYQRGFDVSAAEWRKMFAALETLRVERQMGVVLLSASRVVPFRNPAGADYDRYCPDLHAKAAAVTQRWADVVGFLQLVPQGAQVPRARRARTEARLARILSVERSLGHEAKNRPGLPGEISLGDDPQSAYAAWERALAECDRGAASAGLPGRARTCPLRQPASG